jgi:hypothetical protein
MGLDQIAYAKEHGTEDQQDITTWRKHPNLQGYMETLWRKRGGEGEFNCVSVELSAEDIYKLEDIVHWGKLPKTRGFFYGGDSDAYYKDEDLEFCSKALTLLSQGKKVYYSSWW